ncbi:MAG TPA: hypothetical protein VHS80_12685, partial [Chthoniobacterales bacterium]|nr:hypothetical protein [Chthoniobacterales bacterium]
MDKSISFRGSSGQWCSDWRLEASIFHDPIDGDHLFVSDRLTTKSTICSFEHIGLYERLRQSEQSRSLAWQVLQE